MSEKIVMGKEKVTWMKLTTKPLDNPKNDRKVQKALCACPQIKDRVFDEKSNTVTIKVVCCSPEKVMDRLCKKGDGAICRIETLDPQKPATEKPKAAEKPKDAQPKAAEKPKRPEKPNPAAPAGKDAEKPKEPEKPPNPAPAAGPSSQPMVYSGYYNPVSNVDSTNGSYYAWNQQNGYPERRIYDSYGGGPPPSYSGEEDSACTLM